METDLVVKQVRKKPEVSRLDPIKSIFYWGEKLSEREFTIIATFYETQQVRKKCYALQIFHYRNILLGFKCTVVFGVHMRFIHAQFFPSTVSAPLRCRKLIKKN